MSFHCQNCGECCGPVPIIELEFKEIQAAVRAMPRTQRENLKAQERDELTCFLRDIEKSRCSIYEHRPLACRQFGQIKELPCPHNKPSLVSGKKETLKTLRGHPLIGILGLNIHWNELEEVKWIEMRLIFSR